MDLLRKNLKRWHIITAGVSCLSLAVIILFLSLWEAFGGAGNKIIPIELPGFHELNLKYPGLYVGFYQQIGSNPMPVAELSKLSVQIFSSDNVQSIPVAMNGAGQVFSQFGLRGMMLFSFMIQEPGTYTLSGVYPQGQAGQPVQILLMSESSQDIKPTLVVGGLFFILFLVLGIWILVKLKTGVTRLS